MCDDLVFPHLSVCESTFKRVLKRFAGFVSFPPELQQTHKQERSQLTETFHAAETVLKVRATAAAAVFRPVSHISSLVYAT